MVSFKSAGRYWIHYLRQWLVQTKRYGDEHVARGPESDLVGKFHVPDSFYETQDPINIIRKNIKNWTIVLIKIGT